MYSTLSRAGELPQAGDRAVEHEAAMVDEGNSFGQAGDFGHVVGGEQHSPAAPAHVNPSATIVPACTD
jgi:hypothetical protein